MSTVENEAHYRSDLVVPAAILGTTAVSGFIVGGLVAVLDGMAFGWVALVFAACSIYFTGFRLVLSLEVQRDTLVWRCLLCDGRLPPTAAQMGVARPSGNWWAIRPPGYRTLTVLRGSGLQAFLERWRIGGLGQPT